LIALTLDNLVLQRKYSVRQVRESRDADTYTLQLLFALVRIGAIFRLRLDAGLRQSCISGSLPVPLPFVNLISGGFSHPGYCWSFIPTNSKSLVSLAAYPDRADRL